MADTARIWLIYIINELEALDGTVLKFSGPEAQMVRTLISCAQKVMVERCAALDATEAFRQSADYVTRLVVMVLCSMRLTDLVHGDASVCFAGLQMGLTSEFCMLAFMPSFNNIFDNHVWLANAIAVAEVMSGGGLMTVADTDYNAMPASLLAVPLPVREYVRGLLTRLPVDGRAGIVERSPEAAYLVRHGTECRLVPGHCAALKGVYLPDEPILLTDGFRCTAQRAVTLYYLVIEDFGGDQVPRSNLMPSPDPAVAGPVEIRTSTPLGARSSPIGFVPDDGAAADDSWDDASAVVALSRSLQTIGTHGGLQVPVRSPVLLCHLLSQAADSLDRANQACGTSGMLCLVFRLFVYASLHTSVMSMVEANSDASPKPLDRWDFESVVRSDPNWSYRLCTGVSADSDTSVVPAANYLSAALCEILLPGTRWWTTCDSLDLVAIDRGNPRVPLVWLVPRKVKDAFSDVDRFAESPVSLLKDVFLNQDAAREAEDDLLRSLSLEGAEAPICADAAAIVQGSSDVMMPGTATLRNVILTVWGTVCIPLAESALKSLYDWTPADGVESLTIYLRSNPAPPALVPPLVVILP